MFITRPDFSDEKSIWLTDQRTLRRLIGILGLAMPALLYVFLWVDTGFCRPMPSISHYYYTRVAGILIIVVSMLAVFLLIYKGHDRLDFILSNTAGICALSLLLFPTDNVSDACIDPDTDYWVTILKKSDFRVVFHYAVAGGFLFALALMSIFLFTKSGFSAAGRGIQKRRRNRLYRVLGVLMIAAMLVVLSRKFFHWIPDAWYDDHQLTFWMETVAVECFGIAWLVKGETFLKDKPVA